MADTETRNFALVTKDGLVANVIVVDDEDWLKNHVKEAGYAHAIDVTEKPVGPGHSYNHRTKKFTAPAPPEDLEAPVEGE